MVNLSKERIFAYVYLIAVLSLIFGLSFTVQGNKITGSVVLETASNFVNNVNPLILTISIFLFLLSLAVALFIIRYYQETKKIYPKKIKSIVGVVTLLLIFSFLGFGIYFNNTKNSETANDVGIGPKLLNSKSIGLTGITAKAIAKYSEFGQNVKIDGKEARLVSLIRTPPQSGEISSSFQGIYEVNDEKYLVKYGSTEAVEVTTQNDKFYTWTDPDIGQLYRFPVSGEGPLEIFSEYGEWETSSYDPNFRTREQQLREEAIERQAYEDTWILLNFLLGDFAFGYVDDYCKEQWDSSEYAGQSTIQATGVPEGTVLSSRPLSFATNAIHSSTKGVLLGPSEVCIDELTTITAQAKKSMLLTSFSYQTSWSVTACKEDMQYSVYLANSMDDRIRIASGIANKNDIRSESKQFSYTKNYQSICVQVSDNSTGDDGYSCFNVV